MVVHGCCAEAVKVVGKFNARQIVSRVCAQCALHSLMMVSVGVRSGHCRGGSGGIIFMEAKKKSKVKETLTKCNPLLYHLR